MNSRKTLAKRAHVMMLDRESFCTICYTMTENHQLNVHQATSLIDDTSINFIIVHLKHTTVRRIYPGARPAAAACLTISRTVDAARVVGKR